MAIYSLQIKFSSSPIFENLGSLVIRVCPSVTQKNFCGKCDILASTHQISVATSLTPHDIPGVITENVFGLCQTSPGRKNCHKLRTMSHRVNTEKLPGSHCAPASGA